MASSFEACDRKRACRTSGRRGTFSVKRAARSFLRQPLRVKSELSDNHAGSFDGTKDNTPGDCELPENIPISENELRALETLLGN